MLFRSRISFVLATVVRAERPSSAKPGDRAIVLEGGAIEGFVGGSCVVETVRSHAERLLESPGTVLLRVTPMPDASSTPGLIVVHNHCLSGGTLDLFLEAMVPPVLVHVFGDTPIAHALAAVGDAAGLDVRITAAPDAELSADTDAVVVASHGHDEHPVLLAALAAEVPYIALVASPKRGATVLKGLDISADRAGRIKTPAGLDIGAVEPGEVAVSVLAELIARRRGSIGR